MDGRPGRSQASCFQRGRGRRRPGHHLTNSWRCSHLSWNLLFHVRQWRPGPAVLCRFAPLLRPPRNPAVGQQNQPASGQLPALRDRGGEQQAEAAVAKYQNRPAVCHETTTHGRLKTLSLPSSTLLACRHGEFASMPISSPNQAFSKMILEPALGHSTIAASTIGLNRLK